MVLVFTWTPRIGNCQRHREVTEVLQKIPQMRNVVILAGKVNALQYCLSRLQKTKQQIVLSKPKGRLNDSHQRPTGKGFLLGTHGLTSLRFGPQWLKQHFSHLQGLTIL